MSETSFSQQHNADELGQYRSLSTLAVLALLLGLSSPLLFFSQMFSAIPLAGIALAALALVRIRASSGSQTGGLLAKLGLALSIVFLVAPYAKNYVRDSTSLGIADRVAQRWCAAVAGQRWGEAASLVAPATLYNLIPRSPRPDAPPPKFDLAIATTQFSQDETVQTLSAEQAKANLRMELKGAQFQWSSRNPEIGCIYEVVGAQSELPSLLVVLTRQTLPEGDFLWVVKQWKPVTEEGDL